MMNVRLNNITINCMLAALLSALFASCKDDNEDDETLSHKEGKEVLNFSTYTTGLTRANDVNGSWFMGDGKKFSVSAWYPNNRWYFKSTAATNIPTVDGSIPAEDGIFNTQDKTYYWPSSQADYPISFYAFSNTTGAGWYGNQQTPKDVKFEVKDHAAINYDLVVAYAKAESMPENGVQPLNFIHTLSKVNFTFKGADDEYKYTINKVEIISSGPNAVLSFNNTTIEGSSNMIEWDKYQSKIGEISESTPLVDKNGAKQGFICRYFDTESGSNLNKVIVVNGSNETKRDDNCRLLPQTGKIAIRIYYKIEDENGDLIGNCGYSKTDKDGKHDASEGVRGCKTLIVDLGEVLKDDDNKPLGWQAGKSYRFIITLPTDNFLGDGANGNEPDGVADDLDEEGNDLDGDGDGEESEFGMDEGGYIEFSVKVFSWEDDKRNVNIEIQN